MPDYELIQDMVDAIQDRGVELTDYEKQFISSIIGQYKMKGFLSPKQIALIEKIYLQRTPDGKREPLRFSTIDGLTPAQKMTERFRNEGFTGRSGHDRLRREKGYDE